MHDPQKITSAGFLLFRKSPQPSFLLLKRKKRWDIPKGHVEPGESELAGALRELREETGIARSQVNVDRRFRFEMNAQFRALYLGGRLVDKTYVVLLGYVEGTPEIRLTEHEYCKWFRWNPPHRIQKWLVDPLLLALSQHFDGQQ